MNAYERAKKAKHLMNMDKVIRYTNDEENGVMYTWLSEGIPDGSTLEDFMEYALDEEQYREWCVLFAELMSRLIVKGEWKDGYTLELFNPEEHRDNN